ncbi:MAG: TetR/AcrR family transcriptional regulator [Pseudolabrys sp.]
MARVTVQRQADRREEILAAAKICFARSGFHQTSMNDICAAAGMSAGNLYRYFKSKEDIIIGIAERQSVEAAESFAAVSRAENFREAFAGLARYHLVERDLDDINLCAEVMAESRRNAEVARTHAAIETKLKDELAAMLRKAAARGEIVSEFDLDHVADVLFALGDGFFWRRSVDPKFDPGAMLPMVLKMVDSLLTPGAGKPVQVK